MSVTQDSRTAKGAWQYRFRFKGKRFFAGGFRTKEQASNAEIRAKDAAIDARINPKRIGHDLTFREAGEWWLKEYASTKENDGIDKYFMPVAVEFFGNVRLADMSPEHIENFLDELPNLRDRTITPQTRNRYLQLLKALFNRLRKKRKYAGENWAWFVEPLRAPKARVRFLYPSEEKILTPIVVDYFPQLFPYYFAALHTGMRVSELVHLTVDDVDFAIGQIFVRRGKGNKSRHVPLSAELAAFLKRRAASVAPAQRILGDWTRHRVSKQFRKAAVQSSVMNIAFHALRHTFAARLLGKGESLYKVSIILGHSSQKVTQDHYGHLAFQDLALAIESINGVVSHAAGRAADLQRVVENKGPFIVKNVDSQLV